MPDYVFTKILRLPSFVVPYANADEANHAPNENIKIDCFMALRGPAWQSSVSEQVPPATLRSL